MAVERRLPEWLKVRAPGGPGYMDVTRQVRGRGLHTVCEEAHCPNIGGCWERRTATFMILGDVCTRACAYCAVTSGKPGPLDILEPLRVAHAVEAMGLRYAVVTSVNRDDLPDGGAAVFARCVHEIRLRVPACKVEVLVPDFCGDRDALAAVMAARPEVLNHNIETVRRVFRRVRPKGEYDRSLALLATAREMDAAAITKSGVMVGLGETWEEVVATMRDLRAVGCDLLTVGQYLRPSARHAPVARWYTPEEFGELGRVGESLGFRSVASGPLVRSSYHAEEQHAAVSGGLAGA